MRANDARTATCALDIEVTWRGGTTLRHEHLCPPRSYVLRDRSTGQDDAEFVVSNEWLAGSDHELVSVHGERVTVHGASGTIELALGEQTSLSFGALTFHVRLSQPVQLPAAISAAQVDPKQHGWTLASLAVHALALACMALLPPKASSLSLDALDDDARYSRYLATPVVRDEVLPWSEDQGLDGAGKEQKDAARHAGDEGQAGKPNTPKTDGRMGIRGKDANRVPPKVSAATVGEQGILGVLAASSAYTGPSSEFGSLTALGYDPDNAMGAIFGAQLGENSGFGGLGMRGTGRYGGGDAAGTIGIGSLNTGEAARGAPGRGSMSSVRREARVPDLRVGEASVKGSLSKEVIRRVIHRNLAKVRFCYEQGLSARPDLAGRVSIQFMIAPTGVVQQATAVQSSLGSAQVERCIADAVRLWTFPAPDGGGYVSVSYPFLFERSE
jgi:TonB family protein